MKLIHGLPATLFGTIATVALIQPYAVALSPEQVDTLARQVTVQIDGQNPGSGVMVAREGQTYYVLTAAHVVPSPDEYDVITPDGQKYPIDFKQVKRLPGVDLALVPFTSAKNYQIVTIGSSSQVTVDNLAYVSGFPASRSGDAKATYRFAPGRILAQASRSLANGYAFAYMNDTFAGMSGGPILDQEGKLIGIHGASKTMYTETQGINATSGLKVGLNLGIPIDTFLRIVPQVATNLKLPTASTLNSSPALTSEDLFIQGADLIIVGNDRLALNVFDQSIRLRPNYTGAFLQRGNLRFTLGDLQGAIADFTEVIRLNPKEAAAFNNRGVLRIRLGDQSAAMADFTEAIRLAPQNAENYLNRGYLRANSGDRQSAIADFTEAIRLRFGYAAAYLNRGLARANLGDKPGAITDYNEAIRLDPKYSAAFNNRGLVHDDLGDKQSAMADFNEAIRLDSKNAVAFHNRGNTRADLGDKQGAIIDYAEAIRLDPKYASAYLARGNIRTELRDLQGALADYTEVIRLEPKNAKAYYNRGVIRTNLGDQQGAIADYNEAIRLNPKDAKAYTNRGATRLQLRDVQGAIADFTETIRLDPRDAMAVYNRGAIRLQVGDKPGAITDLQQAAILAQQQSNQQIYQAVLQLLNSLGVGIR
jgi:tetratricopeptide (TPR) repeat protein